MVGGVHMNMDTAGDVGFGPGMAHLADTFLQPGQLRVGEFWRYHLNPVFDVAGARIPAFSFHFRNNAGIAHDAPCLAIRVFHAPFIVTAPHIVRFCAKIIGQRPRSLPASESRHLDLNAKALILHPNHATAPAFNSSSTARIRLAIASITWTVTLLPACL